MTLYDTNAVIMAPLSGYTDIAYRRSMRRHGCRYAFTEMIDVASLFYAHKRSKEMLLRGADEPWLGVQLVGENPEHIKKAVEIVNHYDFDVVDFNLGCPVPKVAKKGAGAALGKQIEKAIDRFKIITDYSIHPVTAKIRILSETDPEPSIRLAEGLAAAGAQALTVHGRIMEKIYSGPVAFEIIKAIQTAIKIPVIANGGIMSATDAAVMREKSCCSRIMLARGAMGNPWLFDEIIHSDTFVPPDLEELKEEMVCHIEEMITLYGETLALRLGRKIVFDYLRGRGFYGQFRNRASSLATREDWQSFQDDFYEGHSISYYQTIPAERKLRLNTTLEKKLEI